MTLYRSIIKDSWKSTIRNKYLWFFGLFAALLGNGGEYEIFVKSMTNNTQDGSVLTPISAILFSNSETFLNLGKRMWEDPTNTSIILLIYLFILTISIFMIWMMIVSQVAIVSSVSRQLRNKEHGLKIGLEKGVFHFWPVFSLNIGVKILIIASLALLSYFSGSVFWIIMFLLIIPSMMLVSFLVKFSIAYIVIRKEKIGEAVKSAWRLFKSNWLISLEMALILYFFTFLAGLAFLFLSFNVVWFWDVISLLAPKLAFLVLTVFLPFSLLLILAFVLSLLTTFQVSAWTRLFVELDSRGAKSKIERMFS